MKLEEKLIQLRKRQGYTQLQLAEELNISRQAVSRWETGAAQPTIDNLKSLSRLYGISLDELLDDGWESRASQTPPGVSPAEERQPLTGREMILYGIILLLSVAIVLLLVMLMQDNGSGGLPPADWKGVVG